jgi:hypothetical protein
MLMNPKKTFIHILKRRDKDVAERNHLAQISKWSPRYPSLSSLHSHVSDASKASTRGMFFSIKPEWRKVS